MRFLFLGIGIGDLRPRLAEPKLQREEDPLALPNTQRDAKPLLEKTSQRFPIPQVGLQASLLGRPAKNLPDKLQLVLGQSAGTPGTNPLLQAGQPFALKGPYPILHRPRSIAKKGSCLPATHALRYQQKPMQPVVIARLLGSSNLFL